MLRRITYPAALLGLPVIRGLMSLGHRPQGKPEQALGISSHSFRAPESSPLDYTQHLRN